jgi:hypothetical protein
MFGRFPKDFGAVPLRPVSHQQQRQMANGEIFQLFGRRSVRRSGRFDRQLPLWSGK